jgi:hypothetical protein
MPTDDSEERARELTRELLRTVRRETGAYASRKRDIYVADVEVAVERFEFFLRIAERVNAPLFCLRRGNDVPIPIAVLPQERGLSPSAEPWHNLGNFEDIYLDREARGRIESYPARETLAFFEQRLEGFLTDRFRARRSDISELPGLPVRVTTRSDGLRAYYSPAYFFDGTQVLNGPTTPTVGWIQPGRYIFGAGSPGKTPRFDFAAEYHVPRGSSNSPVGEYMVSDPTDVFLNL